MSSVWPSVSNIIMTIKTPNVTNIHFNTVVCNDGDIRLCDSDGYCGSDVLAGRLEYCMGETWGSVCNNMWSVSDAKVACIQLGYSVSGDILVKDSCMTLSETHLHSPPPAHAGFDYH